MKILSLGWYRRSVQVKQLCLDTRRHSNVLAAYWPAFIFKGLPACVERRRMPVPRLHPKAGLNPSWATQNFHLVLPEVS